MVFGVVGVLFNQLIFRIQDLFQRFHGGRLGKILLVGAVLGGTCGVLGVFLPAARGRWRCS